MMNEDEFYKTWKDVVERTARIVTRDFPGLELEDVTQELYVTVLENQLNEPDERSRLILKRSAKAYCAKQYAEHQILSPQINYRSSDVKQILERLFYYSSWLQKETQYSEDEDEAIQVYSEPAYDLDDVMTEYSDVRAAFEYIPQHYQRVIFTRYALGEHPGSEAERKRLNRAVDRLCDTLNRWNPPWKRDHQGPGSRKLISNAHARYILATQD